VVAQRTVVIDHGILRSYLHNRETAALFGVAPTGNARAFECADEPLIRMRNTFIEAGTFSLDELIRHVKHGYLVKGPRNGQADANGEFMFGAQEAYLIEQGQLGPLMRGPTVSGNAFDVLQSVDGISRDFALDMGAGYCGKWQLMKVDGGGGHIRCQAVIGGMQG
jgi:TldD protein